MKRYLIASVIEVEEDELCTISAIRLKIDADLNRGDGLYLETSSEVMTFREIPDEKESC